MQSIVPEIAPFYTSYFGNVKNILEAEPDAGLVSIAGKTPDWFDGQRFKKLAPHYAWWKQWHDMFKSNLESRESKRWYESMYFSTVLDNLDARETAQKLKELVGYKTVFLLCYEKPDKFCHRHLVERWLRDAGVDCREFC